MFPKICIINLASSQDRREQITAHLAELGLTAEFFPAIDGRLMSENEIAAVYDPQRSRTTEWGELKRGEIGCALSHRGVWQALLDSGDAGWLVLEDDAVLAADVPEWLAELPRLVKDGEVVPLVQTNDNPYFFHQANLSTKRRLIYPNQSFVTATAYYITPLAARRLLAASMPVWFPVDCWYSKPGFKGVTAIRAIWPAAVHQRSEQEAPSTIGFRSAHLGKLGVGGKRKRSLISRIRLYIKNRFFNRPVLF